MKNPFPTTSCAFFLLCLALPTLPVAAQERRVIPVSVVDKEGNIVEGLTAKNFRGKFRGKKVKMLSATLDTRPRSAG